jgi:hypothetical protein
MKPSQFKKRVAEYVDELNAFDGFDAATQIGLAPLEESDMLAYVTACWRWLFGRDDEMVSRHSPLVGMFHGAAFMAHAETLDAAVLWVQQRYGEDAAQELTVALEDDRKRLEMSREIEVWRSGWADREMQKSNPH